MNAQQLIEFFEHQGISLNVVDGQGFACVYQKALRDDYVAALYQRASHNGVAP